MAFESAQSLVQKNECRYDVSALYSVGELQAKPWLVPRKNVILIDTLRNSTSITVALSAGARDVCLFGKGKESLAQLRAHADAYDGDKLLAGEFEGRAIPGFDCGNSPLDFTRDRVHGRRIFYSSTNGGSALHEVLDLCDKNLFLACLANGPAVGTAIAQGRIDLPLLFLCAGFRGSYCYEDCLTAGQCLLVARSLGADLGLLDDGASTAIELASAWFDGRGEVREPDRLCRHLEMFRCGSVLALMGQAADIAAAVSGKGLQPAVIEEARKCLPVLDRSQSLPRIVHSDFGRQLKDCWERGPVDLSATSAYPRESRATLPALQVT